MGLGVVIAQPAIQQFTDSSFQHLGAAAGAQRRICLRCWDTRRQPGEQRVQIEDDDPCCAQFKKAVIRQDFPFF